MDRAPHLFPVFPADLSPCAHRGLRLLQVTFPVRMMAAFFPTSAAAEPVNRSRGLRTATLSRIAGVFVQS